MGRHFWCVLVWPEEEASSDRRGGVVVACVVVLGRVLSILATIEYMMTLRDGTTLV